MSVVPAILVVLFLSMLPAQAVVLDWSQVTWTPGSLSQSYDVDADGKNDLTVSFSGDTSAIVGGSPTISGSSLGVILDFGNTSGAITVTITFHQCLADELSFSLFDIDADRKGNSSNFAYQDQVSGLIAVNEGSTATPNVTSTPNVTAGSQVSYSGGTALGLDVVPPGSSDGNMDLTYDDPVVSLQFVYGSSGNIAGNNPDEQDFAISAVKFKKVPEVGVAPVAAILCLIMALVRSRLSPAGQS